MKCELCRKNPASFYRLVPSLGRQAAVCVACMQKISVIGKSGLSGFGSAGQLDLIKQLIDAFQPRVSEVQGSDLVNFYSGAKKPVVRNQICPNCGLEFEQYQEQGRFGCSVCYDTFKLRITPIVQEIHGCTRHNGSRPVQGIGEGR